MFAAAIDWEMPQRALDPVTLPCVRHLDGTVDICGEAEKPLVGLLADKRAALLWRQTYHAEDFGSDFMQNYGWVEIFGLRGHFANDVVAGGILILGPNTFYPDHHHLAEEVYVPLTGGSLWRMGDGPFRERGAGEIVHHRSNVSHAMKTLGEPLVALYLWRGGPLDQRSAIVGRD